MSLQNFATAAEFHPHGSGRCWHFSSQRRKSSCPHRAAAHHDPSRVQPAMMMTARLHSIAPIGQATEVRSKHQNQSEPLLARITISLLCRKTRIDSHDRCSKTPFQNGKASLFFLQSGCWIADNPDSARRDVCACARAIRGCICSKPPSREGPNPRQAVSFALAVQTPYFKEPCPVLDVRPAVMQLYPKDRQLFRGTPGWLGLALFHLALFTDSKDLPSTAQVRLHSHAAADHEARCRRPAALRQRWPLKLVRSC